MSARSGQAGSSIRITGPSASRSGSTGGSLLGDLPLSLGELAGAPAPELDEGVEAVQEHGQEAEKGAGSQR